MRTAYYTIKGAGLYQFDKDYFIRDDGTPTPGYRDWRGSAETMGRFNLTDAMVVRMGWRAGDRPGVLPELSHPLAAAAQQAIRSGWD